MNLPFREKIDEKGLHSWAKRNVTVSDRRCCRAGSTIRPSRVFLGGHSYGGRQTTMLAASRPASLTRFFYSHTRCTRPENRHNCGQRTGLACRFRACSCTGPAIRSGPIDEVREAMSLLPPGIQPYECEAPGRLRTECGEPFDQLAARIVGEFARFAGL